SSWEGSAVYRGTPEGDFTAVVSDVKAPADIGYDAKRNALLIPLFMSDAVQIQSLGAPATPAPAPASQPAAAQPAPAQPAAAQPAPAQPAAAQPAPAQPAAAQPAPAQPAAAQPAAAPAPPAKQ